MRGKRLITVLVGLVAVLLGGAGSGGLGLKFNINDSGANIIFEFAGQTKSSISATRILLTIPVRGRKADFCNTRKGEFMGSQTAQKYREFTSAAEAQEWAFLHYADLLNIDRASEVFYTISTYTGSWYKALNGFLRVLPPYGTDDFAKINYFGYEDHLHDVKVILDELNRHSLPENIVVFRFTKMKDLLKCTNSKFFHRGTRFSDKAFLSTTLVKENLEEFAEMHGCTCLLKLCLPKGIAGAYVTFEEDQKLLNEQEFLLPPNITFEVTKIHLLSYPVLIECKAIIP